MKNLMKKSKKGFTLMEMLIVVAIIAILVVIAIPTFTNALNEAREKTDMANCRAWYAEQVVNGMLDADDFDPSDLTAPTYEHGTATIGGTDLETFTVTFVGEHTNESVTFGG